MRTTNQGWYGWYAFLADCPSTIHQSPEKWWKMTRNATSSRMKDQNKTASPHSKTEDALKCWIPSLYIPQRHHPCHFQKRIQCSQNCHRCDEQQASNNTALHRCHHQVQGIKTSELGCLLNQALRFLPTLLNINPHCWKGLPMPPKVLHLHKMHGPSVCFIMLDPYTACFIKVIYAVKRPWIIRITRTRPWKWQCFLWLKKESKVHHPQECSLVNCTVIR